VRRPIDTSRLQFLVVAGAEPLKQYEEGKPREAWAPRVDTNGEVLWRVQLVALRDGEAEIIRVSLPGDPGVRQGEMVRVEDMTAQAWEMDGRSGMAFRAAAIRSASARRRGEGGGMMTGEPARARSRRNRRGEELVALAVGIAGALWRLRLELGLVALLVCGQLVLAGLVGDVVAGVVVAPLFGAVLAIGDLRRWPLRAARVRRAWWRAWTDRECGPGECRRSRPAISSVSAPRAGRRWRRSSSARRSWRSACAGARGPDRARRRQRRHRDRHAGAPRPARGPGLARVAAPRRRGAVALPRGYAVGTPRTAATSASATLCGPAPAPIASV
jgi:hypothetical protein